MQHGSYLIADMESQPHIDRGEAVLYRGLQKARGVFAPQVDTRMSAAVDEGSRPNPGDSVTSFNAMHCNVSRTETGWFNDRTFCSATSAGRQALSRSVRSGHCFTPGTRWRNGAPRKFGANYVKLRTPLSNIRITAFVCSETEVKVIDPNKLEVIEAVGCRVREVCI